MECLVANVDHVTFDVETALDEQYGALPLPFPGMDSKYSVYVIMFIFTCKALYICIENVSRNSRNIYAFRSTST